MTATGQPGRRCGWPARTVAAALAAALVLAGCARPAPRPAATPPEPPASPPAAQDCTAPDCSAVQPGVFHILPLPGADGTTLQALQRGPRTAPLRYRIIVLPGSGCAGLAPLAQRYFAGLLHAQVLVLHKPGVAPQASTRPEDCPPEFVQADALDTWQAHARAALQAWLAQQTGPPLPVLLVGISEGAELLAGLAPAVPQLAGLVLLSASGLDPHEAGTLQAARLGQSAAWAHIGQVQASDAPDSQLLQGRSLRYWRVLWRWRSAQTLVDGPWPLLHVWGDADALVPPQAAQHFAARAAARRAPYCARSLPGADHGLQTAEGHDGVQQVWAWVEQWMRSAHSGCSFFDSCPRLSHKGLRRF